MLSALSDPALAKMKKKFHLTKFTPNSLSSWKQLQGEIEKIRKTGIAYDLEEHMLGISAVGTPIIGPEGEIAAISIPTPSVRFNDTKHQLEAALKDCRAKLIERIGTV